MMYMRKYLFKNKSYFTQSPAQAGQAALISVIFFMLITLAIGGGITSLGLSHLRAANELMYGKKSYATAESGLEDVIMRLSNPLTYTKSLSSTETVLLTGQGHTSVVINQSNGTYSLQTVSDVSKRIRNIKTRFVLENRDGIGFPAALSAGYFGVIIDNSVQIKNADSSKKGNVFSNGTVDSRGASDYVTGEIRAARPIAKDETMGQVQTSASTAWRTKLRSELNNRDLAQSFIAPRTGYITEIKLLIDRSTSNFGNLSPIDVWIFPNEKGKGRPLKQATSISYRNSFSGSNIPLTTGSVPTSWTTIRLNVNRPVYENEKYWIVLDTGGTSYTNYYTLYGADGTAGYVPQNSCYESSWCNTSVASGGELSATYVGSASTSPQWDATTPSWYTTKNAGNADQFQVMDIAFKVLFGEPTYTDAVNFLDPTLSSYLTKIKTAATGGAVKGDAIEGGTVGGAAYYRYLSSSFTANGSTCTTATSTPNCNYGTSAPEPFNLIEVADGKHFMEKIQEYKDVADDNTSGSVSVGNNQTASLGPVKINGDLTLSGSSTLNVSGVVWVTGKVDFSNTCNIRVTPAGSNALILVTGGKVTASESCYVNGRGGNLLLYDTYYDPISTSATEPQNTIQFMNTVNGDVVLFAPFGEVRLSNTANITAVSAAKITAQNSGVVSYKDTLLEPQSPGDDFTKAPDFSAFYEAP